jgi:hypothetical protein
MIQKAILAGQVAWYVTGRFYVEAPSIRDAGYFLHLQGVDGKLFAHDDVSEQTAHFTFLADPFVPKDYTNGALQLGIDPVGSFSVYFQREPRGNFADPDTFALGQRVATFRRVSMVVGATVGSAVTVNTFSAQLVSTNEFDFRGITYDLARLLPNGITQWGTASPQAVMPDVYPFVGSAIAIGSPGRDEFTV